MKVVYRIVAVIALVGIIFTFIGAKDKIERSKAPINMAEVNWSSLKEGDHIIITIDAVWSRVYKDFMTESDSEALIAEYESTGRGYIIPRVHESDLGYRYADYVIGIKTNDESHYQFLDKIMGETYEWYYDDTKTVGRGITTLYFEGYLREMTDEEVAYFTEYLRNVCGYSDEQIESKLCPYMMEKKEAGFGGIFLTIGLILDIVAVGLLAYAIIQDRRGNAIFGKSEYSEVVLHDSADNKAKKAKTDKNIGKAKVEKSSKKVKSSKSKNSIDIDSGFNAAVIEPVKKSNYADKTIEKNSAYEESDNYISISSKKESKSQSDNSFYIDSKEESKSQSDNNFYVDHKENEKEISPLQKKFAETFAKKETVDSVDNSGYIEKSVDENTESYVDSAYVEKSVNEESNSSNTTSSYGASNYGGSLGGSYGGNSGGAYGGSLGGSYGGNSGGAYGGSLGGSYGGNSGGAYGGNSGGAYGGSLGGSYGGGYGGSYGGSLGGGYGGSLGGGYGGSLGGGYGGSLGGSAYGGSGGAYGGSGGSGYGGSGYSDSLRERERGFVGAGSQDSSGSGLKQGGVFDDFWKSLE